eukprot:gene10965-46636_t
MLRSGARRRAAGAPLTPPSGAHGLRNATGLNGAKGTVVGPGAAGRVRVRFAPPHNEKALRMANLRAAPQPGYPKRKAAAAGDGEAGGGWVEASGMLGGLSILRYIDRQIRTEHDAKFRSFLRLFSQMYREENPRAGLLADTARDNATCGGCGLAIGARVEVHGLRVAVDLNGKRGTVVRLPCSDATVDDETV